jgi:hypothetical protein
MSPETTGDIISDFCALLVRKISESSVQLRRCPSHSCCERVHADIEKGSSSATAGVVTGTDDLFLLVVTGASE